MKSLKKIFKTLLVIVITVTSCVVGLRYNAVRVAHAEESRAINIYVTEEKQNNLFVALSLSVKREGNVLTVTASHDFSLLPTLVPVAIYIYSSPTYTINYTEMTLVAFDSVADLDKGKAFSISVTENEPCFWLARMRYSIDDTSVQSLSTGTFYYSSEGVLDYGPELR